LPEPFLTTGLFLIGPRLDLTFTKQLFLTAFFQYNNQIDNININARLQWRFQPVSDFFLVYTENYFGSTGDSKNRALVAKLTYWLNL
ncbi:MAG: hydrolase, partial [Bacteroidota bacterium]